MLLLVKILKVSFAFINLLVTNSKNSGSKGDFITECDWNTGKVLLITLLNGITIWVKLCNVTGFTI